MQFRIGEAARLSRCKVETIRFYERKGLMPPPLRTEGSHRTYGREHVGRLKFIRRCRELGFPLDDVRALLGLVDGERVTCAEVKALTVAQLRAIRGKIADLHRMARVLDRMAQSCAGGNLPDCPIIVALFDASSAPSRTS